MNKTLRYTFSSPLEGERYAPGGREEPRQHHALTLLAIVSKERDLNLVISAAPGY